VFEACCGFRAPAPDAVGESGTSGQQAASTDVENSRAGGLDAASFSSKWMGPEAGGGGASPQSALTIAPPSEAETLVIENHALTEALEEFQHHDDATFQRSAGMLIALLRKPLEKPGDDRFWKVPFTTKSIRDSVVEVKGAVAVLAAAGFEMRENAMVLPTGRESLGRIPGVLARLEDALQARGMPIPRAAAAGGTTNAATKQQSDDDRHKAELLAKIQATRKEEKTYYDSKAQHRGFGGGNKMTATQIGADGGDKPEPPGQIAGGG